MWPAQIVAPRVGIRSPLTVRQTATPRSSSSHDTSTALWSALSSLRELRVPQALDDRTMRTQRNEQAHLAQLLKSTVRRSSVGPDVCCLRHLMASVDDACPTSLALLLGLSSAIDRWTFWQVSDPETVKQAAPPVDEHTVADERSVRPERVPRGVVAAQDAHAYFHCLGGQVFSETMRQGLPATNSASALHFASHTRCGTARAIMGGVRPQDKSSFANRGAVIIACALMSALFSFEGSMSLSMVAVKHVGPTLTGGRLTDSNAPALVSASFTVPPQHCNLEHRTGLIHKLSCH